MNESLNDKRKKEMERRRQIGKIYNRERKTERKKDRKKEGKKERKKEKKQRIELKNQGVKLFCNISKKKIYL